MSVRHGLLALLDGGPKHGYQLRGEFERATGGTWPLNVGQVYTTLNRLERDGLVAGVGGAGDDADESGRLRYELTTAGRDELHHWLATPVGRDARPRDELAIKLALALAVAGADVAAIVQAQRTATLRLMQRYTRLKADLRGGAVSDPAELSWSLVLDSLIFAAEAEIRWLDHCEGRLAEAAARRPAAWTRPAGTDTPEAVAGARRGGDTRRRGEGVRG